MGDKIYSFWLLVKDACTLGGEPYYECANCHGGGHQYGVEGLLEHPNICPNCKATMLGDLDELFGDFMDIESESSKRIIDMYNEVGRNVNEVF